MKINEKIEEMKSNLLKKVIEANSHSKEDEVRLLEEFGLDKESASQLLLAYSSAEDAKNTAKELWDTAWMSRSETEFSTDIAKTQEREAQTREYFESINARCALQIVTMRIEPSKINEELLKDLYENDVKEEDINNPSLRITFHYYSESKAKDIKRAQDLKKVQEYSSRIVDKINKLEDENKSLRQCNESLKKQFEDRTVNDEKHYQAALTQIAELKEKVKQLQERSIFKIIGDKLSGLFGNKRKELPEASDTIPDTLDSTSSGKRDLHVQDESHISITNIEKETAAQSTTVEKETDSAELQQ